MISYFSIVFMLLTNWQSPALGTDCIKMEISEAVEKSDLIAYGTIAGVSEYPDGSLYNLRIKEQFKKSDVLLTASIYQSNSIKHAISFVVGKKYLIYGIWENRYWIKTSCQMRTVPLSEATHDLSYLREYITCEKPKPQNKTGCPKNLRPVCGCNGITYSNGCYAFNDGITWWVPGKCE